MRGLLERALGVILHTIVFLFGFFFLRTKGQNIGSGKVSSSRRHILGAFAVSSTTPWGTLPPPRRATS